MTLERFELLRILEAMLFASHAPLSEKDLAVLLPEGANIVGMLDELKAQFANRGVHLTPVGTGWAFRTAPDLAAYMEIEKSVVRRLSRAAVETLAIVAYHQPVTRAEIEEIRGVSLSRGTLDILLEAGWIRPRGRRQVPGKPITWGTSDAFLDHFGLQSLSALPGVEELKAAGLLDKRQSWSPIMEIEAGDVDAEEIGDDEVYEAVETDDAIAMDK
ncbi:SMC-Scp complex subunit ScpB [Alphaproteobacteria bacterium]|nr:SMC-Scp complex subunit ScpB [Alphaproteobacteria bacterium]